MSKKILTGLIGLVMAGTASADWAVNMPEGVTDLSKATYDIHMLAFWVCVAIGVVVFGVMIYSLFAHRKSKGVEPAQFSHSTAAEVVWTIVPIVILLALAIPSAGLMLELEDDRDTEMSIVITDYQWKWHYDYVDQDVDFYSSLSRPSLEARTLGAENDPFDVDNYLLDVDNPLVVPVDTKIRLMITANDVLHAWYVPDLAIKKDAIPGLVNTTWFEATEVGTYRGQCAELCGKDHGYMPIVVEVVPQEEFQAWVDTQQGNDQRYAATQ